MELRRSILIRLSKASATTFPIKSESPTVGQVAQRATLTSRMPQIERKVVRGHCMTFVLFVNHDIIACHMISLFCYVFRKILEDTCQCKLENVGANRNTGDAEGSFLMLLRQFQAWKTWLQHGSSKASGTIHHIMNDATSRAYVGTVVRKDKCFGIRAPWFKGAMELDPTEMVGDASAKEAFNFSLEC